MGSKILQMTAVSSLPTSFPLFTDKEKQAWTIVYIKVAEETCNNKTNQNQIANFLFLSNGKFKAILYFSLRVWMTHHIVQVCMQNRVKRHCEHGNHDVEVLIYFRQSNGEKCKMQVKMPREGRELFPCEDPGETVNLPFTKMKWLYYLWG